MHILRLDFKNGLHLEFTFKARAGASLARNAVGDAGPDEEVRIEDEAGHDANILRGDVLHYSLVDLAQETESAVLTKLFMDDIGKRVMAANPGLVQVRGAVLDGAGPFGAQPTRPARFAS